MRVIRVEVGDYFYHPERNYLIRVLRVMCFYNLTEKTTEATIMCAVHENNIRQEEQFTMEELSRRVDDMGLLQSLPMAG